MKLFQETDKMIWSSSEQVTDFVVSDANEMMKEFLRKDKMMSAAGRPLEENRFITGSMIFRPMTFRL